MALCTITGFVYMPNGQPAADRLFKFKTSRKGIAAGYFGAIVPEVIEATTDSLGFLTVQLLTGDYVAFSALYNGPVTVPDADEASLYEVFGGTGSVTPPAIAPNFTVLPSLLGSTSLGGTITVNLGAASGSPEPVITGTLTRPGASPVSVTQGQQITVQAGDQGGSLSLTATATNSAGVDTETVSRAIPAAIPAPVFTTPLPDVALAVGDADVIRNLDDSTDNATAYSVSPSGGAVTISGSIMTVSAAAPVDQNYTVTATGQGGTATDTFGVLVEAASGAVIGGAAIGTTGAEGSLYEGFRLVEGDDFDAMPTRWNGRNLTGRYGHSPQHIGFRRTRSQDRAMYIDPAFRGARSESPVDLGYDGVSVANSVLTLTATPSPAELVPMLPTTWTDGQGDAQNRPLLISGSLKTGPSFMLSAGADFVVETRTRMEAGQIRGYWPSFWTSTFFWPDRGEIDVLEGKKTTTGSDPMTTLNNLIASATDGGATQFLTVSQPTMPVGRMVQLAVKKVGGTLSFYDDIAEEGVMALRGSTTSALVGRLTGAQDVRIDLAVSSEWDASTFNIADWPAAVEFDWWRAWVPATAARQNEPLEVLPPVLTTPGGSWAATFPSAASLYGGAAGLEQVSAAFDNFDAPGMPTRNSATKLPSSMTVSLANRTVAGTVPATEGGAMGVFITYAYADGSPAKRTLLPYYVAPAVQSLASGWTYAPGAAVDIAIPFTAFHSGNLGPHTYTVTAPGLTVTGNGTGAVQITGTASATSTITIAATNIQGQTTTVTRPLTVEAVPDPGTPTPYADWTGPGWFDMSDAATITLSGSQVTTVANKRSGGGDLTAAGTVANVVRQTAAQNGRQAVRINRIADAGINTPRLEAPATSPVSALFQGNDSPFTVIMAYRPNDANTGFIWSATAGSGTDTDQTIALVRRTTNASIRRKPLLVSNDVNWGTGQAANVARIVAIRHTGTTVTVWDNSLTKVLTDAAQNFEAFTALLQFTLGASRSNNVSYAGVQATTDYFEAIIENTVRSDADIQRAISDLSAKWGITVT